MCPADPQDGGLGQGPQPPDYQGPRISGLEGGELDPEQFATGSGSAGSVIAAA